MPVNRKLISVIISLIVVSAAAALLFYHGPVSRDSPGKNLTIAWWGNPSRNNKTVKVIELYKNRHRDITVETRVSTWNQYWKVLDNLSQNRALPDIIQQDYAYLQTYVKQNLLADLSPFLKSHIINLETVPEFYKNLAGIEGKVYGIVLGVNAVAIVYDPEILRRAGIEEPETTWKWSDFTEISVEVFRSTGIRTMPVFSINPKVGFENMLIQTGNKFFSRDGLSLGFTDTNLLQYYFELQLELQKEEVLIDTETAFNPETENSRGSFIRGESWVEYIWSNEFSNLREEAGRDLKLFLLPRIDNPRQPGTFFKPSMFFSISESSGLKEESAHFINYFINDHEANLILQGERGVPIVPFVKESVRESVPSDIRKVFDYISLVGDANFSIISAPDPPLGGQVMNLFKEITQKVLNRELTAGEGASGFMENANRILQNQANPGLLMTEITLPCYRFFF